MATAVEQDAPVRRVADELAWELLRDEWELLLAVGSGPTPERRVAESLGEPRASVAARLETLREHGLVEGAQGGWSLVPAVHQRQEGMSSYLRDLVLRRIDLDEPAPVGADVRCGLGGQGGVRSLLTRADDDLFPAVVAAASGPETERSERFLAVFAVSGACAGAGGDGGDVVSGFLHVLRAAALERSREDTAGTAKLWVAEMRVDPEVAMDIAERMESFLGDASSSRGEGAATFAVWPLRAPTARSKE
ncbi:MAG: hypothetical protein ACQEXJ_07900 [Myxococcota bacterium]